MHDRLVCEPLQRSHADELAAVLLNAHVYSYISAQPPTLEQYRRRVERIVSGPPQGRPGISFENYAVRLATTGEVIGTLEATVHDGLVEIAFLFGPQHWGKGYATEALSWFGALLLGRSATTGLWATTHPRNSRSVALLNRCGYMRVDPREAPELLSYQEGDLVFSRPGAA